MVARARLLHAGEEGRGRAKKSRPAELVALIDELSATPPEFAASELTRLALFQIKNDKDWQREVLEEAFVFAGQAQQPFKRVQPPSGEMLSAAIFAKNIADLDMDRLSMQCAVIRAWLEVDPQRALALARELGSPELPVTKCEDAAAPNVDAYYQMLLAVAKSCFNEQQQAKGEDLALLETCLRQVNHPAQVAPASRLVRVAGTTPERLERLLDALLAALDDMRHDDRAFAPGGQLASVSELQTLGVYCTQHGQRGPEVFARVRRYIVEQLSGTRCADNALTATGKPAPLPEAVRQFNQLMIYDEYKIEEITDAEIKPASLGGQAETTRYWQTPTAARLKQQYYEVTFGKPQPRPKDAGPTAPRVIQRPVPDAPEQVQALQEFFAALAQWQFEANVPLTDFYHQKCLLYGEALLMTPPSPLREQAWRAYLNFLSASRAQFNSFPEWYAHFKTLFRYTAMVNGRSTAEALQAALAASDDPLLQLIQRLNKLPVGK